MGELIAGDKVHLRWFTVVLPWDRSQSPLVDETPKEEFLTFELLLEDLLLDKWRELRGSLSLIRCFSSVCRPKYSIWSSGMFGSGMFRTLRVIFWYFSVICVCVCVLGFVLFYFTEVYGSYLFSKKKIPGLWNPFCFKLIDLFFIACLTHFSLSLQYLPFQGSLSTASPKQTPGNVGAQSSSPLTPPLHPHGAADLWLKPSGALTHSFFTDGGRILTRTTQSIPWSAMIFLRSKPSEFS